MKSIRVFHFKPGKKSVLFKFIAFRKKFEIFDNYYGGDEDSLYHDSFTLFAHWFMARVCADSQDFLLLFFLTQNKHFSK